MNPKFRRAMRFMARQPEMDFIERWSIRVCLMVPRWREELERKVTQAAIASGAIRPQDCGEDGLYAGDWMDIWDWLWEHREEILDFIMTIISLF